MTTRPPARESIGRAVGCDGHDEEEEGGDYPVQTAEAAARYASKACESS